MNFPFFSWNLGIPMEIELENGTWKAYFHTRRSRVWKSALKLPFSNEIPWKFQDWKWKKENSWFFWQNNWTDCFFWFLLFFWSSVPIVTLKTVWLLCSLSQTCIFNCFKLVLKAKMADFNHVVINYRWRSLKYELQLILSICSVGVSVIYCCSVWRSQ